MTAIQPKVQAAHQHTPGSSIFSHLFLRGMEHKGCRSSQAGVTRLVGWSTCKASIGLERGCTLLPFTFNSGLSNGSLICYVCARSFGLADPMRDRCLLESHNPASSSILTLHSTPWGLSKSSDKISVLTMKASHLSWRGWQLQSLRFWDTNDL